MHVTAIIAAGGRGQRFGAAVPKQLLIIGGRASSSAASPSSRSSSRGRSHRGAPAGLAANPPEYPARAESAADRGRRNGARIRWRTRSRPSATRPTSSSCTMRRGLRERRSRVADDRGGGRDGAALAALPASDTVKRAEAGPDCSRRRSARVARERDAAARYDPPRANAAGVPARRVARRPRLRQP